MLTCGRVMVQISEKLNLVQIYDNMHPAPQLSDVSV